MQNVRKICNSIIRKDVKLYSHSILIYKGDRAVRKEKSTSEVDRLRRATS